MSVWLQAVLAVVLVVVPVSASLVVVRRIHEYRRARESDYAREFRRVLDLRELGEHCDARDLAARCIIEGLSVDVMRALLAERGAHPSGNDCIP